MSARQRLILAYASLSFVMLGCSLAYPRFPIAPDEMAAPTVRAAYSTGTATLEITREGVSETITLDRVEPGSQLADLMGATVTWRNDAGWVLFLSAFDREEMGGFGPSGSIQFERIEGHEYWIAGGYVDDRCILDVDELSETAVRGSATCLGLRWVDGAGGGVGFGPPQYVEGQPEFDAKVTFQASP